MRTQFIAVAFALLACGAAMAHGVQIKTEEVKEVQISFMPWQATTNRRLSAEDIRSNPNYRLSVCMPWDIATLIKHLPLREMRPTNEAPGDIRLVIDFILINGSRTTLYASQFYLYSEDGKYRWRVTPKFKQLFRFEEMALFKLHAA